MRFRCLAAAGALLASAPVLLADFQYEQTTKITGGMAASAARFAGRRATDGQVATVAVKGSRMVHLSDKSAQIYDLDKGTITHVDLEKKTYTVMTFEQMRDMAKQATERMSKGDAPEMSFTASVKETGQKRTVAGLNANGYILIMAVSGTDKESGRQGAMNMTTDMWMAPQLPGYQEVRDFQRRMAEKMGAGLGGANPMAAMQPGSAKAFAEMAKEMAKLKGIPVLQVTRMGSTADGKPLPAASEAPELSQQSQVNVGEAAGKAANDSAANAATGAAGAALGRLGGMAGGLGGGLGGFGRKKKQEQPAQEQQQAPQQAKAPGGMLMMESTTELSGFSSASVDGSKFEVPAGFKQVQSEWEKRNK
jgi:hypothetical protein